MVVQIYCQLIAIYNNVQYMLHPYVEWKTFSEIFQNRLVFVDFRQCRLKYLVVLYLYVLLGLTVLDGVILLQCLHACVYSGTLSPFVLNRHPKYCHTND